MSTTRFALLFGDDIIVDALAIAAAFGDYAHTFCQLLASSLGPIITEVAFALDAYDVVYDITFPSDDVRYDGLASTEDPTPWVIELLDHVKHILAGQPSLKPYGLCFGRQIIAKAPSGASHARSRNKAYRYRFIVWRTDSEPHIVQVTLSLMRTSLRPKVVYDQGVAVFELTLALLPGISNQVRCACVAVYLSIYVPTRTLQGYFESTAPGLYMWISHSADPV
ncbi:hypothetical protein JVT61DRAFT_7045 [Boletus reticuloceps]|uniref:Uncharacterized protein n=1 Tax=Boletus reticuloceps TaxID=495285 RepID=A0A8I3A615_9AGAM|nr:hypothetical protein JVT61DRAFT_7045 [Boletus reticuloceps]